MEAEQMGRVLLGVLLTIVLVPVCLICWLYFGKVPVAVTDPPFPKEKQIVSVPLNARIGRELIKAPIQPDEDGLVAGAHIYSGKCAICHGFHGKPALFGETYWKVVNGIRLTGMPSYKGLLTDNEIWQVSLLVANADKPLPPEVIDILRGGEQLPTIPSAATEPQTDVTGGQR
jgi:mono/diheme cytochrome c family protein